MNLGKLKIDTILQRKHQVFIAPQKTFSNLKSSVSQQQLIGHPSNFRGNLCQIVIMILG